MALDALLAACCTCGPKCAQACCRREQSNVQFKVNAGVSNGLTIACSTGERGSQQAEGPARAHMVLGQLRGRWGVCGVLEQVARPHNQ